MRHIGVLGARGLRRKETTAMMDRETGTSVGALWLIH